MKPTITILCLLFLLSFHPNLIAQDCNCKVTQVENNTVEPCDKIIGEVVMVSSTSELRTAIIQANDAGGNRTILIADGTYQIATTSWYPYITANDMVFRSLSGNRDAVILTGTGMKDVAPITVNGFYCFGNNITIADLTIKDVGNHAIATEGDNLFVHNVKIQNTFEQMIKGTTGGDGADNAIIQCSLLEYPAGIGPQFYIGGLDIHEGDNWIVRDNIFKNITSPSVSLAQHAVHFWNFSSNNIVERNWIINCDRGIGFGLGSLSNEGGIIRNNMIYNDGSSIFHDVGISLETSPNTKVYNNTIFISYPNAIEYRFAETKNVTIKNNLTNQSIRSRDGGQGELLTNYVTAQESWFKNLTTGDLRIQSEIPSVTNQGTSLPTEVTMDIDQTARPQGGAYDIGASEYIASLTNRAKVKIMIEGYFEESSSRMNTILSDNNIMPLIQPFNVAPFNYAGVEVVSILPANVVDWMLLELRDANNIDQIIHQQAVFLRNDGALITLEGQEEIVFNGVHIGAYHIAVHHLSHLAIISSQAHLIQEIPTLYDFTNNAASAMGVGQLTNKGKQYLMISGDFDGNGVINNEDYNLWKISGAVINIYSPADADGNGIINNLDYNLWKKNKSKIGLLTP